MRMECIQVIDLMGHPECCYQVTCNCRYSFKQWSFGAKSRADKDGFFKIPCNSCGKPIVIDTKQMR